MPILESQPTARSLAEVAWVLSRAGRCARHGSEGSQAEELKGVWQSARSLQRNWGRELDALSERQSLVRIATELFVTELLLRTWAAIVAEQDARCGGADRTRIATNSVSGLLQVRHRVFQLLMDGPADGVAASIDRLRRRCDRWTDLLIGTLDPGDAGIAFAFNPERARDFAEEYRESDGTARPADLLVAAGVRLAFLGQLPAEPLQGPEFDRLMKAVLSGLSESAFRQEGTLAGPESFPEPTAPLANADVLLPGLCLSQLRRRFS